MNINLEALNAFTKTQAEQAFLQCCTSSRWVALMVDSRPYHDREQCQATALKHWATMQEADLLEAFEGHPKIGDVNSLRAKYASTKDLASGEQSAMQQANEASIQGLAEGNKHYETKNGFIFIVCATGKSAEQMLALLQARLENRREDELIIAAQEQAKITAIRIDKLLKRH